LGSMETTTYRSYTCVLCTVAVGYKSYTGLTCMIYLYSTLLQAILWTPHRLLISERKIN
jgi:hypothetical protein